MSRIALVWALMLSLLPAYASADCMPGQKISANASMAWCKQQQISVDVTINFIDTSGNPTELSSTVPASVHAETSFSPIVVGPAVSFVAPDPSAPVYFTLSRSFYQGPCLAGKCVKLVGRICTINGERYINDGAALIETNPTTGSKTSVPTLVRLRADLLVSPLTDGSLVSVQGVCRQESDNSLSLLPLDDAAVAVIR